MENSNTKATEVEFDPRIEESTGEKIKKYFLQEMSVKRIVLIILSLFYVIKNVFYSLENEEVASSKKYKATQAQEEYETQRLQEFGIIIGILFFLFITLRYFNSRAKNTQINNQEKKLK